MNKIIIIFLILLSSTISAQMISPNGYYTEGAKVYDEDHEQVRFIGVNRPSMEWMAKGKYLVEDDFMKMAESGVNIVRIPLNPYYWQNNTSGYHNLIDTVIVWCMKYDMNIILDLHRTQRGNKSSDPDDIFEMADEHSLIFWKEVATKYKDNGKVLFELYNEPNRVDWDIIVEGGMHNGWKAVGYQELYDTVRATGAHNLVIIGGKHWTYDLRYYEENPIDGYNIMYAAHCYPHSDKQPEHWYQWSNIARKYPVIMTEFGPKAGSFYDLSYVEELADTMNALGVHWTAWAWWHTFGNNSMWSNTGFYPGNDTYMSTEYGEWVLKQMKDKPVGSMPNLKSLNVIDKDISVNLNSQMIRFSFESSGIKKVSLINPIGKVVKEKEGGNILFINVDTSHLSKGFYIAHLELENGYFMDYHFVKK